MRREPAPLVSVVVPLFNHEQYVRETIESAIAQQYRPLEIVVVDDGSTDSSHAVAKQFEQRAAPQLDIRVYRRQNGGPAAAMNFGVARSTGKFIAAIASDDYFLPGALQSSVDAFEACAGRPVALVHATVLLMDAGGRSISTAGEHVPAVGRCLLGLLTREAGIWAPTMMFTRDSFDAIGGFDEAIECEDYDFHARLAAKGYEFAFNARDTVVKRVLPASLGANVKRWYEAPFQILDKHRPILTQEQYADMRIRLHLYAVKLAAGGGDYALAHWATARLGLEAGARSAVARAHLLILRYRILNAMPFGLRAQMRMVRALFRRPGRQPVAS
jgi:glycosyltransferase involved in cell wall biosynthesis